MDAQDVVTTDRPVRYRLTIWQLLPYFLLCALILSDEAFFTFFTDAWPALPVTLVPAAALICLTRWFGVTLTPDEAIVHNLRRRRIAWRDVRTVQIERFSGTRIVVLYEANGRRTRLRAPMAGFLNRDNSFEEKFHVIGQWWVRHGDFQAGAAGGFGATGFGGTGAMRTVDGIGATGGMGTVAGIGAAGGWGAQDPAAPWSGRSRIRLAATQIVPILVLLSWLLLNAIANAVITPTGASDRPEIPFLVVTVALSIVIIEAIWHFAVNAGVAATTEGLKVHNLRTRRLPWAEIASFSVEATWHGTRLVVHELSGRRTRLSGPRIGFLFWDDDFAAKALAIHGWWRAAHGGVAVAPLDLSGVRRPAAWKKALVSLAAAAFASELLLGGMMTLLHSA